MVRCSREPRTMTLLRRLNMDERRPAATTAEGDHLFLAEGDDTGDGCMDRPILPHVYVLTRAIPVAFLANENFTGIHRLATKALYTTSFGV